MHTLGSYGKKERFVFFFQKILQVTTSHVCPILILHFPKVRADPGHVHSSLRSLQHELVSLNKKRGLLSQHPVTELNASTLLGATSIGKQQNASRAHLSQQHCLVFTSIWLSLPGDLRWDLLISPSRRVLTSQMLQC